MNKTYKGYELIKAIADGEIKKGTEFSTGNKVKMYFDGMALRHKENRCGMKANEEIGMSWLKGDFELLEDEIDIDSIEEIKIGTICDTRDLIINELIKTVKQLNKEIKELTEK